MVSVEKICIDIQCHLILVPQMKTSHVCHHKCVLLRTSLGLIHLKRQFWITDARFMEVTRPLITALRSDICDVNPSDCRSKPVWYLRGICYIARDLLSRHAGKAKESLQVPTEEYIVDGCVTLKYLQNRKLKDI